MENFVFPDENKTKLIKLYELMNIWTATQRERHQSKKAQHVDLLTSTY